MVAILGYSKEQIRHAVKEMYTVVANRPNTPQHFPIGKGACLKVGYTDDLLEDLPKAALESFAGVGCPFHADLIRPGDKVLDVGSGSGTDTLIASRLVGENGKVWAFDMTEAMRQKLQGTLDTHGIKNVEILEGEAEKIPLPDNCIDVVTSNGVLNLVSDKRKAISEIFRVLKPGGQAQIADIVIASPVTPDCEGDPKLWAECVVGATVDENYLNMFRDAGFEEVELVREYDYFSHSPSKETKEVANRFGAYAIELRLRRGAKAPAKAVQYLRRLSPGRLVADFQRRGLWGAVGLGLALLACYGTLAIVALASILGITLTVNSSAWAGSIVVFAALTAIVIGLGIRIHHNPFPFLLALVGAITIAYVMFVSYSLAVELTGFGILAIATYWDYQLKRWAKVPTTVTQPSA